MHHIEALPRSGFWRLRTAVAPLRRSTFLKHNAIFFVGAAAMGLLNYLYYPVMGRLLPPDRFGEVQALVSLFAQITIFLNVLSLLTVNIVANYSDTARRNRVIMELEKLAIFISGVIVLATAMAMGMLRQFFHFGSGVPFVMLALAVLVSAPLTFRTGYLRGQRLFGLVALAGIVASAGDLLFSIVLVVAGKGTTGAILGLVIAQAVACGFAAYLAKRRGFTESLRQSMVRLPDLRLVLPELKYALLVLVGSLAITGLYSIDTVVVKHYFDAHTAGLYAGISTIARIVFFLTASIAQVLLPSIKLHAAPGHNQQTLRKSFILLMIVGGGALVLFAAVPRFIIRVLMGATYLPYANLLPRLGLLIFVVSLLNLFILYHMALRRYAMMVVVLIGVVLTAALLAVYHQTLVAVIDSLLFGSLSILALLGLWLAGRKRNAMQMKEEG